METYHSNMARRWMLSLHDPLLFPLVTLIIMDVFLQKMRIKKNRKMLIIEEAWKAIASPMMAEYGEPDTPKCVSPVRGRAFGNLP